MPGIGWTYLASSVLFREFVEEERRNRPHAWLQILAKAPPCLRLMSVSVLRPIPIPAARHRGDVFSVALAW